MAKIRPPWGKTRPPWAKIRPPWAKIRPPWANIKPPGLRSGPSLPSSGLRGGDGRTDGRKDGQKDGKTEGQKEGRTYGNLPLCSTGHPPFGAAAQKGQLTLNLVQLTIFADILNG